jgi:spore germination protein YaaH
MIRRPLRCRDVSALVVAGLSLVHCANTADAPPAPPRIGVWLTYWELARGLERAEQSPAAADDVFLFLASLTPEGTARLDVAEEVCRDAVGRMQARSSSTWLTIVNDVRAARSATLKDGGLVQRLLADTARRRAHVQDIARLAQQVGVAGVDIDYEAVPVAAREDFTAFIRELAIELHAQGRLVSVTAAPKRRESNAAGPGALDWAQLARAADRLQIMLYNEHSDKSEPGPIASVRWAADVLRYAETQAPRGTLVPVFKVAGLDWGPTGADGLQYENAMALAQQQGAAILRDGESNVPYFSYSSKGASHTVYFEDAASIMRKFDAVKARGYRGVVLWSLGREDPALLAQLLPAPTPTPAQKPQ